MMVCLDWIGQDGSVFTGVPAPREEGAEEGPRTVGWRWVTAGRSALSHSAVASPAVIHGLAAPQVEHSFARATLLGDRRGQYSIRINQQWRICFEWPKGVAGPSNVEIVDYH